MSLQQHAIILNCTKPVLLTMSKKTFFRRRRFVDSIVLEWQKGNKYQTRNNSQRRRAGLMKENKKEGDVTITFKKLRLESLVFKKIRKLLIMVSHCWLSELIGGMGRNTGNREEFGLLSKLWVLRLPTIYVENMWTIRVPKSSDTGSWQKSSQIFIA